MLMFAGMQTGNLGDAAHGADVIADLLRDVLIGPPTTHMMMTLEGYLSTIPHVDIRFGRWQTVLDAVFDGDPAHRPVSWAMHHYARAVASAALGMFDSARQAAEAFEDARAAVPAEYAFFNNPADAVLTVADLMMRGEMAYHAGEIETAFDLLQQAINAEDGLGYNEPRAWMHPPRHALGALMLEQGRVAEALAIYECDLATPAICRSADRIVATSGLAGLAECLHRLGGEDTGAADTELAAAMRATGPSRPRCRCGCGGCRDRLKAVSICSVAFPCPARAGHCGNGMAHFDPPDRLAGPVYHSAAVLSGTGKGWSASSSGMSAASLVRRHGMTGHNRADLDDPAAIDVLDEVEM